MKLLYGHSAEVSAWVAAQVPHMGPGADFGPNVAIGVIDERGDLVGGVVYHNYLPQYGNIELSFAATSRRWLTRPIIRALLRYAFVDANCQRVTGLTPRKATSARRFLDKFGFKREGLVRRGFGTDDAVISGLLRTEWDPDNWRPKKLSQVGRVRGHGEAETSSTA